MGRVMVRHLPKSQVKTPQQRAQERAEALSQQAAEHELRGNRFMAQRLRTHAANLLASRREPTTDILGAGDYGPEFRWVYNHKNNDAVYQR